MTWEIRQGDCIEQMREMDEASVDAIVCDPPAGIGFMGKPWDGDKGGRNAWVAWLTEVMVEAWRVAKPGAHALIWALPRTSHWTGWAIEEAGWEVRDRIAHHFGSGFPKSLNIGNGQGTALKPATEDWWLARKPLSGTVSQTVLEHGTGALNIDACRISADDQRLASISQDASRSSGAGSNGDSDPSRESSLSLHNLRMALVGAAAGLPDPHSRLVASDLAHALGHRPVLDFQDGYLTCSRCGDALVRLGVAVAQEASPSPLDARSTLSRQWLAGRIRELRCADHLSSWDALGRLVDSSDTSYSAGQTGRWPANVALSHLPECESVGTRKVRGATSVGRNRDGDAISNEVYGARRKDTTDQGYAASDGTEKVTAWRCAEATIETFRVSAEAPTALRALAGSRIVGSMPAQASEVSYEVQVPGASDSQADCPACHRSGDALARLLSDDALAPSQRLDDALALVLEVGRDLRSHSQKDQPDVPRSSLDGAPAGDRSRRKTESRTSDAPASAPPSELASARRSSGTSSSAPPLGARRDSKHENRTSQRENASPSSPSRSADTSGVCPHLAAIVLRFAASHTSLATVAVEKRNLCPVAELDRQSGTLTSGAGDVSGVGRDDERDWRFRGGGQLYGDTGGASRFFYVAKSSRAERNAGLDGFEATERRTMDGGEIISEGRQETRGATVAQNVHPTVKPTDLMRWLCRLVTPSGGTILDPFTGSGTTGIAAHLEGFDFIGIEREAEYVAIAQARIEWWSQFSPGTETDAALGLDAVDRKQRDAGQRSLLDQLEGAA